MRDKMFSPPRSSIVIDETPIGVAGSDGEELLLFEATAGSRGPPGIADFSYSVFRPRHGKVLHLVKTQMRTTPRSLNVVTRLDDIQRWCTLVSPPFPSSVRFPSL